MMEYKDRFGDRRSMALADEEEVKKALGALAPEERATATVRPITKQTYDKYAPCACGSGKKYKFCCFGKAKIRIR